MRNLSRRPRTLTTCALVLAAVPVAALPLSAPAWAQASGMAGIGTSDTVSIQATVRSVDPATRGLTLIGPAGNTVSLVAGPRVINFDRIKPGDKVAVQYEESATYVLTPRGGATPNSSLTVAGAGAPKGAMPAGAVGAKLVVTGLVAGIDPADHSLQLVDPSGGQLHTVHVVSQAGLQNFGLIKVGDRITAVTTQAIAAVVEPAH